MGKALIVTLAVASLGLASIVLAEEARPVGERQLRRVLRQAFPALPQGWQPRLAPDATMTTCAKWRNQPPKEVADRIKSTESARIFRPPDGNYIGDWRRGEAIAQSGYGLRFTDTDPSRPNGGNCYACHKLSPDEVSYGTIGVSLEGYGRIHKFDPAYAQIVYDKIYNSQAIVPCSLMPRFGANAILTSEQIKDLVALLMHPDSPINREPKQEAVRGAAPASPAPAAGPPAAGRPAKQPR
ncbi:MAG: sulfur oxidation c-type cytochrome SoxX [Hyphomicrobiaceae bacterium]